MKINNEQIQQIAEAQGIKAKGKVGRTAQTSGVRESDAVTVSASSQDLGKALSVIANASDVRPEKVADVAKQIEAGTYQPSGSSIVDSLFGGDA